MKNSTILVVMAILILVVGGFVFVKAGKGITGNTINDGSFGNSGSQKVVLTMEGYNYKTAYAKAGQSISISADSSVWGCMRSVVFNIDGKRYSAYLKTEEDVLELPSLEKGTYSFSCTMGMGFGKLIVE